MSKEGQPGLGLSRWDKSWALEIRCMKTFPVVRRMGPRAHLGQGEDNGLWEVNGVYRVYQVGAEVRR